MKLRQLLSLILLVMLLASCDQGRRQRQVKKAVMEFSQAVLTGDSGALEQIAPPFALPAKDLQKQLFQVLQSFPEWNVKTVHIDGDVAIAAVELSNGDRTTQIQIPLSWREDRWIIPEVFRVRTTIDVIPAR